MTQKLTILAALAAFSLIPASAQNAAAKPEVPKIEHPATAPALQTAKFWRLVAQAQGARQQLNDSVQGKAAAKADEAVQEAQQELQKSCGDTFVLGYGADGDIACVAKPAPTAAVTPPAKKEK